MKTTTYRGHTIQINKYKVPRGYMFDAIVDGEQYWTHANDSDEALSFAKAMVDRKPTYGCISCRGW